MRSRRDGGLVLVADRLLARSAALARPARSPAPPADELDDHCICRTHRQIRPPNLSPLGSASRSRPVSRRAALASSSASCIRRSDSSTFSRARSSAVALALERALRGGELALRRLAALACCRRARSLGAPLGPCPSSGGPAPQGAPARPARSRPPAARESSRPRSIASATSGSLDAACSVSPTRVRTCEPPPRAPRPIASAARSSESISPPARARRGLAQLRRGRSTPASISSCAARSSSPSSRRLRHLVGLAHRQLVDEPRRAGRLLQALHPVRRLGVAIRAQRLRELVPRGGEFLERPVIESVEGLLVTQFSRCHVRI